MFIIFSYDEFSVHIVIIITNDDFTNHSYVIIINAELVILNSISFTHNFVVSCNPHDYNFKIDYLQGDIITSCFSYDDEIDHLVVGDTYFIYPFVVNGVYVNAFACRKRVEALNPRIINDNLVNVC